MSILTRGLGRLAVLTRGLGDVLRALAAVPGPLIRGFFRPKKIAISPQMRRLRIMREDEEILFMPPPIPLRKPE